LCWPTTACYNPKLLHFKLQKIPKFSTGPAYEELYHISGFQFSLGIQPFHPNEPSPERPSAVPTSVFIYMTTTTSMDAKG